MIFIPHYQSSMVRCFTSSHFVLPILVTWILIFHISTLLLTIFCFATWGNSWSHPEIDTAKQEHIIPNEPYLFDLNTTCASVFLSKLFKKKTVARQFSQQYDFLYYTKISYLFNITLYNKPCGIRNTFLKVTILIILVIIIWERDLWI